MDNVNFLSGLPIPSGHRIAYSVSDAGTSGILHVGATFLMGGRIVEYNMEHNLGDFNQVQDINYIYMDDCQLLNIGAICLDNVGPSNERIFKCWIEKQIGGGNNIITGVLGSVSLVESNSFQWPFPNRDYHICCQGYPKVRSFSDSVPDTTITVPINNLWRLHQIYAGLNTSATVGDRYVGLIISDGTDIIHEVYCETSIPASSNLRVTFFNGGGSGGAPATGTAWQSMPEIFCFQLYEITLTVFNADPSDNWAFANLQYNRRYVGY